MVILKLELQLQNKYKQNLKWLWTRNLEAQNVQLEFELKHFAKWTILQHLANLNNVHGSYQRQVEDSMLVFQFF